VKKLSGLIIGVLLVSSLLCGVWLVRLSVSDGEVVLYLQPEIINVEPGQVFTVNVSILNVQYLIKWIMGLSWNSSVIELEPASSSAVYEGPFMKSFGLTYFTVQPYSANSGYLCSVSCEFKQPTSASGSGILFFVRFKAKARGETAISIVNSVLYDRNKQKIPHTCKQAFVSSTSTIHDIAVSLEAPSTLVLGNSALINVTITNKGETDETDVKLNVLINGVSWQTQNLALLGMGKAERFTYSWKPESKGTYNITVYATLKSSETDLANNRDQRIANVVELVHDIAVSLEVPGEVVKGEVVNIKVYVENVGAYNETNIDLSISINNLIVNETVIDFLSPGSIKKITYNWTPDPEGAYVITASVSPTVGETILNNNEASKTVNVIISTQGKQILIVSDDDSPYYHKGTSLKEFEDALVFAGYGYDVWKESIKGRPSLRNLLNYELVIWTVGDHVVPAIDTLDMKTLINYSLCHGKLLIEGECIAFEGSSEFRSKVLHIDFNGYLPSSSVHGMLVSKQNHLITKDIENITWSSIPYYQVDCVTPNFGSYSVMRFYGEDYYFNVSASRSYLSAVTVFDGVDAGSVIYFAFALSNIQESTEILVKNCVDWLLREDISTVGSKLVNAPEGYVYFIYADPSYITVNETFGMVAGATVYGSCKSPQKQGFVTNKDWVAYGKINSTEINGAIIALFGNPEYHELVKNYEDEGLTPIRFYENETHYMLLHDGKTVISVSKEDVEKGLDDAFVIYTFSDGKNEFLVMYGFSWKSMWDAGKFFVDVMSKSFMCYAQNVYIAKWDCVANCYFEIRISG